MMQILNTIFILGKMYTYQFSEDIRQLKLQFTNTFCSKNGFNSIIKSLGIKNRANFNFISDVPVLVYSTMTSLSKWNISGKIKKEENVAEESRQFIEYVPCLWKRPFVTKCYWSFCLPTAVTWVNLKISGLIESKFFVFFFKTNWSLKFLVCASQ